MHYVYFDMDLNSMTSVFIFTKFTQNNAERKVNEVAKAHEKKLKLNVLRRSYKVQRLAAKDKFLTPRTRIFGVS